MPTVIEPSFDTSNYPQWVQDMAVETQEAAHAVGQHEAWYRFSDGTIPREQHHALLIGFWPLIERFPQYLALNLLKCSYADDAALNAARGWLIKNVRTEQRHAEWYRDWAESAGISRHQLFHGTRQASATAITDWCWHICQFGSLAEGMAATNFAIEGVIGKWSRIVAASAEYQELFPEVERKKAMKWIYAHAAYDDKHSTEAMELIVALLGKDPPVKEVEGVQRAIQKSYDLYLLAIETGMRA